MSDNSISIDAALEMLANLINESIEDVKQGVELESLEGWDSMGVLLLMAELDERFAIVLDVDKITNFKTVDDVLALLSENNALDS